ncbi:hypothetical protein WA026_011353 [Henosepilachna vigintioctopunctata]|uniref:acid phosphatase n=1 Tax=Henosepilachna vigintioctopunctata TaxID=420089 RepID=A0AAW1TS03_9CUCU
MRSLLIILQLSSLLTYSRSEDDLVAVTALIRHGARIPEELYPTDPYQNYSFPFVLGDLTNSGVNQMYTVGKWLRNRYKTFLSREYDPEEIYCQSVDYDRCLMSGSATLAGLYPPISNEVWNSRLRWQPIPIHTSPAGQDIVVNMNTCPKIPAESAVIRSTQIYQDIMSKHGAFFDFISNKSGESINFSNMYPLFDTLFSEMKINLPLPEWAQKILPQMSSLIVEYTKMDSYNQVERQIQVGPMLERIVQQFDKAINGKNFGNTRTIFRKFMAYFATEWILYDMTYALGLPPINIPDFGAFYLFELRKNPQSGHYVNILYKHSTNFDTAAKPAPIKGLNYNLDYTSFKNFVKPLVVNSTEWKYLCENFTGSAVSVNTNVPSS